MKVYRKVLSVVLAIAMVVTLCVVQAPTKSYAGVKIIVGKKLDITVGSKDTIVVKGKAKAKSTSKKVAKITKTKKKKKITTITVKGMKSGKAKIKVKVKKKTKKVSVTVRPKTVTGIRVVGNNTTAIVSWYKAAGAVKYEVYRSNNSASGFAKIATVTGTTYKNSGLAAGKYYYYKVLAIGNKNIKSEKYSAVRYHKTWKLEWSDEFNGTEIDSSVWTHETGHGKDGWGNDELQDYRPEYAGINDGKLEIRPQFDYDKAAGKNVPNSYYSSRMITKGNKEFLYGKIEFRARMPKGVGTWAAGWMLGTGAGGKWPKCGEIDVFETTSQVEKTIIPQSLHMDRFHGGGGAAANKYWNTTVNTATTEFHTYAVEWYPTFIKFTVDGKQPSGYNKGIYDPSEYCSDPKDYMITSHQLVDPTKKLANDGTEDFSIWPYCKPFYLIVNCAIGGTLGGTPNPAYWNKEIPKSGDIVTYQDILEYDYIRVYK